MTYSEAKKRHDAAIALVEYYRVEMLRAKKPIGRNCVRAMAQRLTAKQAMINCGVLKSRT